jgi:type IV pilus assembly protein PilC
MATFEYKAYDKEGNPKTGVVEASDQETAASLLRDLELTVTSLEIRVKRGFEIPISLGKKVSSKELVVFSRQLATMINAGLPLVRALRILEEQSENKEFKKILDKVASDVEAGTSLSTAMNKDPKTFGKVYTTMVRSGEASGKLDNVLLRLAEQFEKNYAMISKIRSAMAYPVFILVALVGVAVLMIVMVVPQLKSLFEEAGVELPWTTKLLIAVSDFFSNYWWLAIILLVGFVFGFRFWISTKEGRKTWDRAKLKIPVFGNLAKKIYIARFTRTLGTLVAGGLPILEALEITSEAVGNTLYKEGIEDTAKKVEAGVGIGITLRKNKNFPIMVSQMIDVGEKTGNIDEILGRLADFFESEVDALTKTLSSLLEPILMVIMGVGVGLIVAAVIMPIYGLVQAF